MPNNTRTKILATVSSENTTKEKIQSLIDAGVDGFRQNFSHGSHEGHKQTCNLIRQVAKENNKTITIVGDLQGPKLRVGKFIDNETLLQNGQFFTLDMSEELGNNSRVCLPHKEIFEALKVGDKLLVNDGNIVLEVIECDNKTAKTKVLVGGIISSKKGVNLPNSALNISPLTPKDLKDLDFALEIGMDCVCLSFVQRASDIIEARKIIGNRAWIISKLEKPQVMEDLDTIIELSDMVMVARGDLGVECPVVTVPVLQKKIVETSRKHSKPVIIATQMLESMISSPMPTRAEVSDIANAVYEGCDVVMLSGETAVGKYPIETVKTMHGVIEEVESDPRYYDTINQFCQGYLCKNEEHAITHAANEVVDTMDNLTCIVTFSVTGTTTLSMAQERPQLPIISINPDEIVANRLNLAWGVKTYINKNVFTSFDNIDDTAKDCAKYYNLNQEGKFAIVTAGYPFGKVGSTNVLHIVKM